MSQERQHQQTFRILLIKWSCFGLQDMTAEFIRRGYQVDDFELPRTSEDTRLNTDLGERIVRSIVGRGYDFIFSFNYFPVVALACNACRVKYVSWVYDSPFIQLYSNTIVYPYNYVFIFDQAVCTDLQQKGIDTVHYLPMAAPAERYDAIHLSDALIENYQSEISFVGSTYSEQKNQFYEKLQGMNDYTRGYLEGIIGVQKQVYGTFLLEELLSDDIISELQRVCPIYTNEDGFETPKWVYANYFLARKVTALERSEILQQLSAKHRVCLYTNEDTPHLKAVENKGCAELYTEAPIIYKCAKINLNISLRSIISGIPLRAMDILGCGGFLMTNYQEDFLDFFVPNEDFVYYESSEDLLQKAEYYLTHEQERRRIAENGYRKVKQFHTYTNRVDEILHIINELE